MEDLEQAHARLGIRTLHGDAVSIKVTKGKTYKITIRSAAGPEIEVDEDGAAGDASAVRSWSHVQPSRSTRPRIEAHQPLRRS